MKLTGYETYCLYLAMKNHFTKDSYDFFKYHGKVSATKESFLHRKDRFQFEKLARHADDVQSHMLANFLQDKTWVGEMLDDEAYDITKRYVKIIQSMSYTFKNEIEKVDDMKELFRFKENQYPLIITMVMNGEMSLQTFVILDHFIKFIQNFDVKLKDDFIWSKLSIKARKYKPFLFQDLDQKKFKEILKQHVFAAI